MEVKELVKALRCGATAEEIAACEIHKRDGWCGLCINSYISNSATAMESMQEELDRVKAERDAAVKDILARDHCDVCKHNHGDSDQCEANEYDCNGCKAPCMCASCRDESNWQWRGLEGRKEL